MEYNEAFFARIEEALEDEAYNDSFMSASSPADVTALFADKGINVEAEFSQALFDKLEEIRNNDGQLSEADLELVAGGRGGKKAKGTGIIVLCTLVGALAGPGGAAAGGAVGTYIACKYY